MNEINSTVQQSPVLSQVSYDNGNIFVNWLPIAGATYFMTSLFLNDAPITGLSKVASGIATFITPNPPLQSNQNYTVKTAQCDASGNLLTPYSLPFNILLSSVTDIIAIYDKQTITVLWTPPAYGNPTGAMITLRQQGNDEPVATVSTKGSSITFTLAAPLLSNKDYELQVSPTSNSGGSIGPDNNIALLVTEPTASKVSYSYDTDLITASAATPPPAAGSNLCITLYVADKEIDQAVGSSITAMVSLAHSSLDFSQLYTITLRYYNGSAYGPESRPIPILICPPILQTAIFQETAISAFWNNLPNRLTPLGGRIGVIGDGKGLTSNDVQGYSGTVNLPPEVYNTYQIQVYSNFGLSEGPRCQPVTVPSTKPIITAVDVNANNITVTWNQIANAPGYRVIISDAGGQPISFLDTKVAAATLAAPLDPSMSYTAAVCQYGLNNSITVSGPYSDPLPIIPAVPLITAITSINSILTVSWNAILNAAPLGITGFTIGLFDPDTLVSIADPVTVSGAAASSGTIPFPLSGNLRAAVMVWAVGSQTTGGKSLPVGAILDIPVITSIDNSASGLFLTWEPITNPVVSGYKIVYTHDGQQSTTITDTAITLPNDAAAISIQAIGGGAVGPAASLPDPLKDKPVLTSIRVHSSQITVAWNQIANAPGYRVIISDAGGQPISFLDTKVAAATLAAPLDSSMSYTAAVCEYGLNSNVTVSGPYSDPLHIIPAVPLITAITAINSALTVSWNAILNAAALGITGFTIGLFDPDTLVSIADPVTVSSAAASSGTIPFPPNGNLRAAVMVWAVGQNTTGAVSKPMNAVIATVEIIHADISASEINITWNPLEWPAIDQYKITISNQDGSLHNEYYSSKTSATISTAALQSSQIWAKVAACTNTAIGPDSSPVSLFGDGYSYYPMTISPSDNTPYLVRCSTNSPQPYDIILAFPAIFIDTDINFPIISGPFTMEKSNEENFPYKLTILASSDVWKFDAATRSALFSAFTTFLTALEMQNATMIIQTGALTMVKQAMALALPLLYSETLLYYNGFNPENSQGGYVDLYPGMRLRLDSEIYQFTAPNGLSNGYVPNGSQTYTLHSYLEGGILKIGFDAFLSALQRPKLDASSKGGGGMIDIYAPLGRKSFYRLFYPRTIIASSDASSQTTSNSAVIVGADSFTDLCSATKDYETNGNFNNSPNVYPFFFRGRTIPIAEIQVTVNGTSHYVPLGTTVKNLLTSFNSLPTCQTRPVDGFILTRAIGSLVDFTAEDTISTAAIKTNRIRLEMKPTCFNPSKPDFFDLPVQQGDTLTIFAPKG